MTSHGRVAGLRAKRLVIAAALVLAVLVVGDSAGAVGTRGAGDRLPTVRKASTPNRPIAALHTSRQKLSAIPTSALASTMSPVTPSLPPQPTSPPSPQTAPPLVSVAFSRPGADAAKATRSAEPVVFDAARSHRLQAIVDEWTANAVGVETMTVGLRVGGRTWEAAARHDRDPGPDANDRYRAMSITKTVTAALVFRTIEAGLLDLDAPLPAIDGVSAPVPADITIRRLLAHRSGLSDYTEAPGYQADQPMTPEKAVELSLRAPLVTKPGTATRYVNSNYLLLGLLLQQVRHRSYADLVSDLTRPLGLVDTKVEPPDRPGWAGFSSGGIMSTAGELAVWGEALFTPGRVVSAQSLTSMSTTGDLQGGLGLWGVCPCSDASSGLRRFSAIGHFTAAGGMFHFPGTGITLVMKAEPATGDTVARAVSLHEALVAEFAS